MDIRIPAHISKTLTELQQLARIGTIELISKITEEADLSTWRSVSLPLDNVQLLHADTAGDAR
jgi:hypothetical protein